MLPVKLMITRLLHGRHLIAALVYGLPFIAMTIMGAIWLREHGWLLRFALISLAAIGLWRVAIWLLLRRERAEQKARISDLAEEPLVTAHPDWTEKEAELFDSLSSFIRLRLAEPLPWGDLQSFALEIMSRAAASASDDKRGALDFSIPEALLLVDRVAMRLRQDLRHYVPMADTIHISSLIWLWTHRARFSRGFGVARLGYSLFHLVAAAPAAVAREIQNILLGAATEQLKSGGEVLLKQLILEEVAAAAIDLHAGYLRFSEAEILDIELASHQTDQHHRAEDDLALRIMVLGQVSAGKTSLINALFDSELGETDLAPATPGLVTHEVDLDGLAFSVVDTQGIDGSAATNELLLREMAQSDLLLWVVRANRPARDVDLILLEAFRQRMATTPARRVPPVIVAVTAVDRLLPGWPWPENILPAEALEKLGAVVRRISDDLGETQVLPVSSIEPRWNMAELRILINSVSAECIKVQRNRRRLQRADEERGVFHEFSRAGRGIAQTATTAGRLLWSRTRS